MGAAGVQGDARLSAWQPPCFVSYYLVPVLFHHYSTIVMSTAKTVPLGPPVLLLPCPCPQKPPGEMLSPSADGFLVARTLIKAGPASSIPLTRNPYHHSVPLLSLSRSICRLPSHITGTARRTGTKMAARCRKRIPVQRGSQTYEPRRRIIL